MNDDWDDSNESEGIKAMRKQIKEQGKLLKEQTELINQFQTQNRGTVLANALTSRGLDGRVAKFYPSDLGTDDESVDKWYNENKDVFGVGRLPAAQPVEKETTLSEAEQRGYQAMTDMEAYDARVVQDFKSQIDQIKYDPTNPDAAEADLLALLKTNGVNLASM